MKAARCKQRVLAYIGSQPDVNLAIAFYEEKTSRPDRRVGKDYYATRMQDAITALKKYRKKAGIKPSRRKPDMTTGVVGDYLRRMEGSSRECWCGHAREQHSNGSGQCDECRIMSPLCG